MQKKKKSGLYMEYRPMKIHTADEFSIVSPLETSLQIYWFLVFESGLHCQAEGHAYFTD